MKMFCVTIIRHSKLIRYFCPVNKVAMYTNTLKTILIQRDTKSKLNVQTFEKKEFKTF